MTGVLVVMDIVWCLAMRSAWSSKPWTNHTTWAVFDYLRSLTLFFSFVNIINKVVILVKLKELSVEYY